MAPSKSAGSRRERDEHSALSAPPTARWISAGGRAGRGAPRDSGEVRRYQTDDAQRHRDAGRLGESPCPRFHERGGRQRTVNWAIEFESPIDLQQSGWTEDSLQPGDAITVQGIAARNGSHQVWSRSTVMTQPTSRAPRARRHAAGGAAVAPAHAARAGRSVRGSARCRALTATGDTRARRCCREQRQDRHGRVRAAEEHRRCRQGGADAALGTGALCQSAAAFPAGRSDVPELQTAGGTASVSVRHMVCSSWKTASGSGFSCCSAAAIETTASSTSTAAATGPG